MPMADDINQLFKAQAGAGYTPEPKGARVRVPDGKYFAEIDAVEHKYSSNGKPYVVITYTIVSEGEHLGKQVESRHFYEAVDKEGKPFALRQLMDFGYYAGIDIAKFSNSEAPVQAFIASLSEELPTFSVHIAVKNKSREYNGKTYNDENIYINGYGSFSVKKTSEPQQAIPF